jgi:hypothetical protein
MAQGPLSKEFDEKAAQPPQLAPEAYQLLLEKLLAEGKGFGKTEAVAAYLLRNMSIVTEDNGKGEKEQKIKVQPLYVVMDLKEWPNEYGRSLVMQEIGVQYAKRMVGENEMNAPDFKAPGIWTAKKSAFESDYIRRSGTDWNGIPSNVYEPNPEAFRVCLTVDAPVTIPTAWGAPWTIAPGGAFAIREKDVPALAEALQSIHDGRTTAAQALFEEKDGKTVAKFDAYGMMPGFLGDNYKPVPLNEVTQQLAEDFAPSPSATMPVLRFRK